MYKKTAVGGNAQLRAETPVVFKVALALSLTNTLIKKGYDARTLVVSNSKRLKRPPEKFTETDRLEHFLKELITKSIIFVFSIFINIYCIQMLLIRHLHTVE
uniref:Uncharacterized protein n=1 Tax=Glossina palpalis gambiensis TaxID=67801 RepID=A0A1B0B8B7_9MUSC